jgi:hypothetical protein
VIRALTRQYFPREDNALTALIRALSGEAKSVVREFDQELNAFERLLWQAEEELYVWDESRARDYFMDWHIFVAERFKWFQQEVLEQFGGRPDEEQLLEPLMLRYYELNRRMAYLFERQGFQEDARYVLGEASMLVAFYYYFLLTNFKRTTEFCARAPQAVRDHYFGLEGTFVYPTGDHTIALEPIAHVFGQHQKALEAKVGRGGGEAGEFLREKLLSLDENDRRAEIIQEMLGQLQDPRSRKALRKTDGNNGDPLRDWAVERCEHYGLLPYPRLAHYMKDHPDLRQGVLRDEGKLEVLHSIIQYTDASIAHHHIRSLAVAKVLFDQYQDDWRQAQVRGESYGPPLDEDHLYLVLLASLLQDVSKGKPEVLRVIKKFGKLTEAERDVIRGHGRQSVQLMDDPSQWTGGKNMWELLEENGFIQNHDRSILRLLVQYHADMNHYEEDSYFQSLSPEEKEQVAIMVGMVHLPDAVDAANDRSYGRPYKMHEGIKPQRVIYEEENKTGRQNVTALQRVIVHEKVRAAYLHIIEGRGDRLRALETSLRETERFHELILWLEEARRLADLSSEPAPDVTKVHLGVVVGVLALGWSLDHLRLLITNVNRSDMGSGILAALLICWVVASVLMFFLPSEKNQRA